MSVKQRELKREVLVAKFAAKYAELKAIIDDFKKSEQDRYAARLALQKLPRNAYPTRQRNRCLLTGRPRGTFRKFGLGRNKIRELAFKGDIPGASGTHCAGASATPGERRSALRRTSSRRWQCP